MRIVGIVLAAFTALVALLPAAQAQTPAQTQGVSDTEIVLGTTLDLSGPINFWGVPARNGMEMAVDEINAAGGIHGRKLRLVVEDMAYDPKKAVLATEKLLTRDRVFAVIGSMGTVTTAATMPLVLRRGVPHLFPIAPSEMFALPFDRLKFASFVPYYDDVRNSLKYLMANRHYGRIGVLYQDDDFGSEILRAVRDQLEAVGAKPVSVQSYKRGATDFSSQIARLKADEADLVVLGTIVRETVGAMTAARNLGWNPAFLVSQAGYSMAVAALGKDMVEGLYAGVVTPLPYADTASAPVLDWMKRYKARTQQDAAIEAVVGYAQITLAAQGIANAGRELTAGSLVAGLERIRNHRNIFGASPMSFSADNHLGSRRSALARLQQGRWVLLTDFMSHGDK